MGQGCFEWKNGLDMWNNNEKSGSRPRAGGRLTKKPSGRQSGWNAEIKRKMRKIFCPYGFWTVEDVLYVMGWIVLLSGICIGVFCAVAPELADRISLPCPVRLFTGMYCPGCGGTRALRYLLRGDIKNSLIHHPVVFYMSCIGCVFMASQTISRLCHGRTWAMRYRNIYLYILIALYALNFLWKNISLLVFHVRVIV